MFLSCEAELTFFQRMLFCVKIILSENLVLFLISNFNPSHKQSPRDIPRALNFPLGSSPGLTARCESREGALENGKSTHPCSRVPELGWVGQARFPMELAFGAVGSQVLEAMRLVP